MFDYVGPQLTRARLADLLNAEGVADRAYSLFGAHKEEAIAIAIDNRPPGWVVFYTERGSERQLRTYDSEAEACLDLLSRVLGDEHNRFDLVAGPAPPAEADEAFRLWLQDHRIDRTELADVDWKVQDSPWKAGEPDYRRYWIRITRARRR
ncbi:MAG: hypothetical protein M0Z30_23415 [Actinomycetota bacterium]|nr:hypothetical protein [Actinomycetota bacterium]